MGCRSVSSLLRPIFFFLSLSFSPFLSLSLSLSLVSFHSSPLSFFFRSDLFWFFDHVPSRTITTTIGTTQSLFRWSAQFARDINLSPSPLVTVPSSCSCACLAQTDIWYHVLINLVSRNTLAAHGYAEYFAIQVIKKKSRRFFFFSFQDFYLYAKKEEIIRENKMQK